MVVAEGTLGERKNWRCLNAFGNGEAGEKLPPALKVSDEGSRRGAGFFDSLLRAAQLLCERAAHIPAQYVRRRSLVPVFDEGAQQVVVISIYKRVAAPADGLRFGKLGAGADGEDFLGNDLALKDDVVEIVSQCVDLMLPEVANHGDCAADIAIEGGVADGHFCFVGVAAERAAEGSRGCGDKTGAAVTRLNIFLDQTAELQAELLACVQAGDGRALELRNGVLVAFGDGHNGVVRAECLRQPCCQIARSVRIIA